MKRRQFIAFVGGAAVAWPLVGHSQQPERVRRVGVLLPYAESDPEYGSLVTAFADELQRLGWKNERDLHIEYRWTGGAADRVKALALEFVSATPDVIVAITPPVLQAVKDQTRTIPIVFLNVGDPVGAGFVQSLAKPGGNITGVTNFEFGIAGKWLELFKEFVPGLTRVVVLLPPGHVTNAGYLDTIKAVAVGVQVTPAFVRDSGEIERAIVQFARGANGGLIVLPNPVTTVHRKLIVTSAAAHRLPAIYPFRFFATDGGLMSYGVDLRANFRGAAHYVDKILKGAKPADLPVEQPTKFELVINLKTANALGLNMPQSILLRADEVIE